MLQTKHEADFTKRNLPRHRCYAAPMPIAFKESLCNPRLGFRNQNSYIHTSLRKFLRLFYGSMYKTLTALWKLNQLNIDSDLVVTYEWSPFPIRGSANCLKYSDRGGQTNNYGLCSAGIYV